MCIRDRGLSIAAFGYTAEWDSTDQIPRRAVQEGLITRLGTCLLYTSDAADERSSVDLGGRRIIKKKNSNKTSVNTRDSKKIPNDRVR